ncbi:MAG: SPFH domain-containing protein [Caldisericia bacterium]
MTLDPFESERVRNNNKINKGWIIFGVLCILVFAGYIFFQSAVIIDDGQLGHVYSGGELVDIYGSGFHFINPFSQELKLYSTKMQNYSILTESFSSDDQDVFLSVDVLYRFYPDCFDESLENKSESQIVNLLIGSNVSKIFRNVVSDYRAMDIPGNRDEIANRCSMLLKEEIHELKTISIDDIFITNINYSEGFYKRIEKTVMPKVLEEYEQKSFERTP